MQAKLASSMLTSSNVLITPARWFKLDSANLPSFLVHINYCLLYFSEEDVLLCERKEEFLGVVLRQIDCKFIYVSDFYGKPSLKADRVTVWVDESILGLLAEIVNEKGGEYFECLVATYLEDAKPRHIVLSCEQFMQSEKSLLPFMLLKTL